jgi:hypothetical protein
MVPTLCVGTGFLDAPESSGVSGAQERHRQHSHALRGNDRALHVLG